MSVDTLVSRLRGVLRRGDDRYLSCCPAHDDQSPSLSIRVLDDGRVLVHCFGGCSAHDVVAAVGLELSDLFPPNPLGHRIPPDRVPFPAADALAAATQEVLLVAIIAGRLRDGESASKEAAQRLALAASRLFAAADLALPSADRLRARRAAQRIAADLPE